MSNCPPTKGDRMSTARLSSLIFHQQVGDWRNVLYGDIQAEPVPPLPKQEVLFRIDRSMKKEAELTLQKLRDHVQAEMFYINLEHPDLDLSVKSDDPVVPAVGPTKIWQTCPAAAPEPQQPTASTETTTATETTSENGESITVQSTLTYSESGSLERNSTRLVFDPRFHCDIQFDPRCHCDIQIDPRFHCDIQIDPRCHCDIQIDLDATVTLRSTLDSTVTFRSTLDATVTFRSTLDAIVTFSSTPRFHCDIQIDLDATVTFNSTLNAVVTFSWTLDAVVRFTSILDVVGTFSSTIDAAMAFNFNSTHPHGEPGHAAEGAVPEARHHQVHKHSAEADLGPHRQVHRVLPGEEGIGLHSRRPSTYSVGILNFESLTEDCDEDFRIKEEMEAACLCINDALEAIQAF
ncbi:hypothetical protein CEXT_7351 [Caerostris extrusa]|uniref:Uncharacterized protein n=1 Tax=Caerostris extrusa TaxID=172846 RepID=A0AAV4XRU0_CAEEX|nr:hypothetical protein CEXT_7351 [Caerostris extrusa]